VVLSGFGEKAIILIRNINALKIANIFAVAAKRNRRHSGVMSRFLDKGHDEKMKQDCCINVFD